MRTELTYASLFSGCGGADLGLDRAGLECLWHCEIEKHPSAILKRHWPNVPNYGDIRELSGSSIPVPDVLWMSPPCQDLSVAGQRKGLEGSRSNLFYEAIRIAGDLVGRGTRWVLMEQVPGLFSSNGREDFRSVLRAFLDIGAVDIGWRVLDSQWFGVPQRRRRAYFAVDFGGKSAPEILALAEGLSGHPKPSREAGQEVAGTIRGGAEGCRGFSDPADAVDTMVVSGTIGSQNMNHAAGASNESDFLIARRGGFGHYIESDSGGTQPEPVIAFGWNKSSKQTMQTGDVADPCQASGTSNPAVCYSVREDATAKNGGNFSATEIDTALAVNAVQPGEQSHHAQVFIVAPPVQVQWASGGGNLENDTAQAVRAGAETNYQFVRDAYTVRRLTPLECERLQGFPDRHTATGIGDKGEYELSDAARYRMIGNAVTANVAEYLGRNLKQCLSTE